MVLCINKYFVFYTLARFFKKPSVSTLSFLPFSLNSYTLAIAPLRSPQSPLFHGIPFSLNFYTTE